MFRRGFGHALHPRRRRARGWRRIAALGASLCLIAMLVAAPDEEEPRRVGLEKGAPLEYEVMAPRTVSVPVILEVGETQGAGGATKPGLSSSAGIDPSGTSSAELVPPVEPAPRLNTGASGAPSEQGVNENATTVQLQEAAPLPPDPPAWRHPSPSDVRIQLAAVKAEADAHRAWARFQQAQPDLLGALELKLVKAAGPDGRTFWRVQASIEGDADARQICRELRHRDVDCFIVR